MKLFRTLIVVIMFAEVAAQISTSMALYELQADIVRARHVQNHRISRRRTHRQTHRRNYPVSMESATSTETQSKSTNSIRQFLSYCMAIFT